MINVVVTVSNNGQAIVTTALPRSEMVPSESSDPSHLTSTIAETGVVYLLIAFSR
jgi:hypothetical protein